MWPLLFFSIFFFSLHSRCYKCANLFWFYQIRCINIAICQNLFRCVYFFILCIPSSFHWSQHVYERLNFTASFISCTVPWILFVPLTKNRNKNQNWILAIIQKIFNALFCLEFKLFAFSCMRPWHQQQNVVAFCNLNLNSAVFDKMSHLVLHHWIIFFCLC